MYVEMLCIITSINQAQSLWIKEFNFKGVNTLALSLPLRLPHPLGDYSKCVCAYHSLQSTLTEEAFLENGLNGLFRGEALRLPKWRVSLAPPRWFVMFPQLQTEPNYGFKKSSIFTFATCKLAWKNLQCYQKILGKVLNNSSKMKNFQVSEKWTLTHSSHQVSGSRPLKGWLIGKLLAKARVW